MNIKIVGSVMAVVGLTIALLIFINLDTEILNFPNMKSPAFQKCNQLINEIQESNSCDQKWSLFQEQFRDCESFPHAQATEGEFQATNFKDILFHIGECFSNQRQSAKALEVYNRGLQFEDWTREDHFNSYSAHFLIQRAVDLSQVSKNTKCPSLISFEENIKKFSSTAEPSFIQELLYSNNVLDTQVMASDAGGYLSYEEWKKVFEESKSQYKLQFLKSVAKNCFVTTGWDQDYPWRAFCAEKIGECFYLMTIYAGIEATLGDFEEFKKTQERSGN